MYNSTHLCWQSSGCDCGLWMDPLGGHVLSQKKRLAVRAWELTPWIHTHTVLAPAWSPVVNSSSQWEGQDGWNRHAGLGWCDKSFRPLSFIRNCDWYKRSFGRFKNHCWSMETTPWCDMIFLFHVPCITTPQTHSSPLVVRGQD